MRIGIPFKKRERQSKGHVIIDMSKLNFNSNDQEKSAIIYLRNMLEPSMELDFSECDYARKEKLLTIYLTSNFCFKQYSFINAVVELEARYIGLENSTSYFTPEECDKYIKNNKNIFEELSSIYSSTPLIFMHGSFIDDTIERKITKYIGKNVRYIYENKRTDELVLNSDRTPIYYEDLASDDVFRENLYKSSSVLPLIANTASNTDTKTINQIICKINELVEKGD